MLSQVCGYVEDFSISNHQLSPPSSPPLHNASFVQTSMSTVLFGELRVLFVGKGLLQFNLVIDNIVNVISKTKRKAL